MEPPPGDSCAEPVVVELLTGQARTVAFRTEELADDTRPACASRSLRDAVLELKAPAGATLIIRATTAVASTVALAVRSRCEEPDEVGAACLDAPAAHAGVMVVHGATAPLFLVVESDAPRVELTVTAVEPDRGTCQAPVPIPLPPGDTWIRMSPAGRGDRSTASCGVSAAEDLTVQLDVEASDTLELSALADEPLTVPVVSVGAGGCTGTELACVRGTGPAASAGLGLVPPRALLVTVDAEGPGAVTVVARLHPPSPRESCDSPQLLVVDEGGLTVDGSTVGAQDDGAALCGGGGAPDQVYRVDVTAGASMYAQLTPLTEGFSPVLSVTQGACGTLEVGCSAAPARALNVSRLAGGPAYLHVDGLSGSSGAYRLEVRVGEPARGDTCQARLVVVLQPDAGPVRLEGDLRLAADDVSNSCGGAGPDVVYLVRPVEPATLVARATPLVPGFVPTVSFGGCSAATFSCAESLDGGAAIAGIPDVPTSGVSVVVDSNGGAGPYELILEAVPRPPGDVCAVPVVVAFDGGQGAIDTMVDLDSFFPHQGNPACGGSGSDAFVRVEIPYPGQVSARLLEPDGGAFLYRLEGCAPRFPNACGPQVAPATTLTSATFSLDTDAPFPAGAHAVRFEYQPATPGFLCEAPAVLFADAGLPDAGPRQVTVTGSTADAGNDFNFVCPTAAELFYQVVLTAPRARLDFSLVRDGGSPPRGYWYRKLGSCGSGSGLPCTSAGSYLNPPPGEYFVVVEDNDPAPFTLTVTVQ